MAVTAAITNAGKEALLAGTFVAGDTWKIALYTDAKTATFAAYSVTNEATGTGYSAGGATLAGFTTSLDTGVGILEWTDPTWAGLTTSFRSAVIYDDTDAGKTTLYVIDYGATQSITAGTLTLAMPAFAAATALVQIA